MEPKAPLVRRTHMTLTSSRVFAFAAVAILLASCGSEDFPPTANDSPVASNNQLADGDYLADGLPAPYVKGDLLRLSIKGDSISFDATCNRFGGMLEQRDGRLLVSNLSATEMGCETPQMEQDTWLGDFFSREPSVTIDGDDVVLQSGADQIMLSLVDGLETEAADPAGKDWVLSGIEESDGDTVSMRVVESRPPLRLEGNQLTFNTGCNNGTAQVKASDNEWEVSVVATTKMACRGSNGRVEQTFLKVMRAGVVTVTTTDSSLRISAKGKPNLTLVYVPA
jgi:heat shock protein HslJ